MEHTKLHSLLFMPKHERLREISKIEGFDDIVTENHQISISTDYGSENIMYNREELIREISEQFSNDIPEMIKVKKAMESVLNKELDDDKASTLFNTLNFLDREKAKQLSSILLHIHRIRYKSIFRDKDDILDVEKTFAICDVIDDCISLLESDKPSQHLGYLKQAASTINTVIKGKRKDIYKYLTTLKLAVLYDLVECSPNEVKEIFKNAETFDSCELIELYNMKSMRVRGVSDHHLRYLKKEIENEIDIILSDYEIKPHYSLSGNSLQSSDKFEVIPTILNHLRGGNVFSFDRLHELYVGKKEVTTKLNTSDIFKFNVAFPTYSTERCKSVEGDTVWLATDYINLLILLKDVNTGDLLYVTLVSNCNIQKELDLLMGNDNIPKENLYINRVKFKGPSDIDLATVTEGIKFTEDGGIKLTYKPVSTYMDDYSRINKVLVQNSRNGNIEGMKTDLVFLFAFINELEKITKGKVRVKDSVKKDAEKARMFAIGDFKQFLAIVQENDPMFNFSKFFEENYKDEDKVLVEFSNNDIKGFKKLLRTILG